MPINLVAINGYKAKFIVLQTCTQAHKIKSDKLSKIFAFFKLDEQDHLRTNSLYTLQNSKYVSGRSSWAELFEGLFQLRSISN